MFVKKNKTVGLCLMVVTSCFILATLWAVLATPETALAAPPEGKGKPGSDFDYKMVIDTADFEHESVALLTDGGDGAPWTFFTRKKVEPTGSTYPIGDDELGIVVQFKERKGVLSGLSIQGNGESVWHMSDVVPVDPPFTLVAGEDMVIVVNVDDIPIHRRNKNGPVIGTIAIGTIRLTVVP